MHNSAYTPFFGFVLYDIVVQRSAIKWCTLVSAVSTRLHSTTAFRQHWPKIDQISSVKMSHVNVLYAYSQIRKHTAADTVHKRI